MLEKDGYVFETETDTETVAHLVTRAIDRALIRSRQFARLPQLRGAFAIAIMFKGEEICWSPPAMVRLSPSAMAKAKCIWAPMR